MVRPPYTALQITALKMLDRNSRSPREMINRMKIREILGVKKLR